MLKTDNMKINIDGLELEIPHYINHIQIENGFVFGLFPNSDPKLTDEGKLLPTYPTGGNYVMLGSIDDTSINVIYDTYKKSKMYPEYFKSDRKIARALFTIDGYEVEEFTGGGMTDEECYTSLNAFVDLIKTNGFQRRVKKLNCQR